MCILLLLSPYNLVNIVLSNPNPNPNPLGISKKEFKNAVGTLFKEGR